MTFCIDIAEEFRRDWELFHADRLPFGWLLRLRADLPWVRFHALPSSRRYANVEAERKVIIARANALADELLGSGQNCWVVDVETRLPSLANQAILSGAARSYLDQNVWPLSARRERWQSGSRDAELLSIADGASSRALWMRCDNGAVFAPYDGGFDLFPATWDAVDRMKARWPDWLSDHPSGL